MNKTTNKNMKKLEQHIVGENGLGYTLGKDDLYYPDLALPEGTHYVIGRYGRMRGEYLREYRRGFYLKLLMSGRLNEYLHQTDEECCQMMDRLVEQMKAKQGVTEQLKAENQMLWVGKMNNIRQCAEEVVLRELAYA